MENRKVAVFDQQWDKREIIDCDRTPRSSRVGQTNRLTNFLFSTMNNKAAKRAREREREWVEIRNLKIINHIEVSLAVLILTYFVHHLYHLSWLFTVCVWDHWIHWLFRSYRSLSLLYSVLYDIEWIKMEFSQFTRVGVWNNDPCICRIRKHETSCK